MPVIVNGAVNLSALTVPDVYVDVAAPPVAPVGGAPSNGLGIVGTAIWGPVNSATVVGSPAQATQMFGAQQNSAHDLVSQVAIAALQGASNFALVRVTDGTDAAATATIQTNGGTVTAKYTGSRGNGMTFAIATGTAQGSWKVTIALPGLLPETFDNITGSGNAFWVNLAAAINNGQNAIRGPSQLAVFSAGASTNAPTAATVTLAGGADGASGVTSTQLIGADNSPGTGMYALRNSGVAVALLSGCATPSTWSTQLAFALSEALQMVDANAAGDTPSAFATAMSSAAVDSPWFKAMVGDWCWWQDTVNGVTRLMSPAAFYAGLKVAQSPEQSALNKELLGIVGTQKSYANQKYSNADLQVIAAARGDVITNPVAGGQYFACRFGRNSSSDRGRRQDAYTTLTDFLAVSLDGWGGQFVGRLMTPDETREVQSSISSFLQTLKSNGQISAFSVTVQNDNARGVQTAVVQVTYFAVTEVFVVDLTGGQTVQINTPSNPA